MASLNRERLLRLIVELNIDEVSKARLLTQLNRIQDRWSNTAKRRAETELQRSISRAKTEHQQTQALSKERARAQALTSRTEERKERQKQQVETARLRTQHQENVRRVRDTDREQKRLSSARDSLDRQRSRAFTRSQEVRHRTEMRNLRSRERAEDRMMQKGRRHLRLGVAAGGAAVGGALYAFQRILSEQGREAIQLRGTADALDIPIKDLQQLIYVARIMGLYFGPAELADAQNKMIITQREMRRHKAGELPYERLNIGSQKLTELGVDSEDVVMGNMLPIIRLMAEAWLEGDREVMAALNNLFEEQVGKRVGVISTAIATGEWDKMLAVDLLSAEEIDTMSSMYRKMIMVIHELEVAMQRFLVGHKDDVSSFLADIRAIIHTAGFLVGHLSLLGPLLQNIIPILVGLGAGLVVIAYKLWSAAWAAAALSAATGQWQNIAAFAAIGIGAGIFTRFLLDKVVPLAEVDPPATEVNQLKTISSIEGTNDSIESTNARIEGDLNNILCIARNAQTDATTATTAATKVREQLEARLRDNPTTADMLRYRELYPMDSYKGIRQRLAYGQSFVEQQMSPEAWKQRYDQQQQQPYTNFTRAWEYQYYQQQPSPQPPQAWQQQLSQPSLVQQPPQPWQPLQDIPQRAWQQQLIEYPALFGDTNRLIELSNNSNIEDNSELSETNQENVGVQVLGDMNINVDTVTDISEALQETEEYIKSIE